MILPEQRMLEATLDLKIDSSFIQKGNLELLLNRDADVSGINHPDIFLSQQGSKFSENLEESGTLYDNFVRKNCRSRQPVQRV